MSTEAIKPGDDFNRRAEWRDILEPIGYKIDHTKGDTIYWTRPGKDSGTSATTGYCSNETSGDLLRVFTSNAPPLEEGEPYSKFRAFTFLNHRGDFNAATKALAAKGYGTRTNVYQGNGHHNGNGAQKDTPPPPPRVPLTLTTLADLVQEYPTMRPPIIDGLMRVGETMNLIAAPKFGKSWMAAWLAFCVATGRPWYGFPTNPGDVLVIDNELHPETLSSRWKRVADSAGCFDEAKDHIQLLSLRGRLQSLPEIGTFLRSLQPGRFSLVILDAFYRAVPTGTDENDNAAIANLYNLIDTYTDHLKCGFVSIHHASKGNQAGKGITDVGSGAGSQSRAADSHLILRPHQEENVVVLDAVVRSFAPVVPKCLRWSWPFFTVAEGLDPADLAESNNRRKAKKPDEQTTEPPHERIRREKDTADNTLLLVALDKADPKHTGVGFTHLRRLAALTADRMARAVQRLKDEAIIEEIEVEITIGHNAKRPSRGIKRKNIGSSDGNIGLLNPSDVEHTSDGCSLS